MENGSGVPTIATVMISVGMIALGAALMVPLWRRGISIGPAAFAVAGAVFASGGGSTLARETGGEGWVLTLGRFTAVGAAAWVSHAFVRSRRERSERTGSDAVSRDPGWPLWALLPHAMFRRDPRMAKEQITPLRVLFFAFGFALVLFWFVLSFLQHEAEPAGASDDVVFAIAAAAALIAIAALLVGMRVESRVVDADDQDVLSAYRSTWFVRVGLAEIGPLIGFAGTFVTTASWLYPFALLVSVPAWFALAPSARNLMRIDEDRRLAGRGSLFERLLEPAEPTEP